MKVNQNRRSFLVFNFPICLCNYHLKGFSAFSHFQSHNHTITSWPIEIAQKTAQVDKINSRNLTTPGNGSFVRTPFASHFSITFLPRYLTHSRLFLSCADLSFFPFLTNPSFLPFEGCFPLSFVKLTASLMMR